MTSKYKFKVNGEFVYIDDINELPEYYYNNQVAIALIDIMIKHNLFTIMCDTNLLIERYY